MQTHFVVPSDRVLRAAWYSDSNSSHRDDHPPRHDVSQLRANWTACYAGLGQHVLDRQRHIWYCKLSYGQLAEPPQSVCDMIAAFQ